ncbi:MAG: hypothetical protein NVSMB64_19550 [Candidatus Velthaea sp.]
MKRTLAQMGWDALAALGSLGQFVVVLIAATIGVAQLRQLHRQNELQATIPYFAYTRTTEFNAGFRIVRDEVLGVTDDVELKAALAAADLGHARVLAVFNLANFFNELGVLVQAGMIDVDTVVPYFRFQIVATWEVFRPMCAARRRNGVVGFMAPLEALAVRAAAYDESARFVQSRRALPPRFRAAFDRSVAETAAFQARQAPKSL